MEPPGASLERVPHANRRLTPRSWRGLGATEVAAVLEAFARGRASGRAADGGIFDGVRVDAGDGLGPEASALVRAVGAAGLAPLVTFPVAGAGEAGYAREGELVLDERWADLVAAMRDDAGARLAFLADPAAVISRCQGAPQEVWARARRACESRGLTILGLATSFRRAPGSAYERLWVYMLRQGAAQRFEVDFAPAFRCREWNAPVTPGSAALPDFCREGIDQLERVRYLGDRRLAAPVYSRAFQCVLDTAPEVDATIRCAAIVYTDQGGWRLLAGEGSEAAWPREPTTDELLRVMAEAAERGAEVRLVIDPADVEPPVAARAAPSSRVRPLPYPHHFFIGLSSDVDWTTPARFEAQAVELCDRLGLEAAGSAYPFSPARQWVSWAGRGPITDRPVDAAQARLARWACEGLLDTFHGLAASFETVAFRPLAGGDDSAGAEAGPPAEKRIEYLPERPIRAADHDGILVVVRGSAELLERPPELEARTRSGRSLALAAPAGRHGGEHVCFHYELGDTAAEEIVEGLSLRARAGVAEAIVDVLTTFATSESVERLLGHLRRANARMPVFTSHGGGAGSRRLAACVTAARGESRGEAVALSMDAPGSPFHVLPALARFGVFFFNPIGWFGTKEPLGIDELLRADANRDGSSSYVFRRFCSRRFEEDGGSPIWAHGKLSSSAQGLAANLEDLLQRFHWLEPGRGAILYTHLGHGVGNQVNDRLGWTEELHAAWERVAEFAQGRDRERPVPFRLWHAPASRILAFSLLNRELEPHLRVDGDEIHIASWRDEILDLDLPSPAGFGDAWLHGVTLYADDPAATAVFVDGRRVEHLTVNPADETGRPSVTLVDGGNLVPLVHGPGSLEAPPPAGARLAGAADEPPGLEVDGDAELDLAIRPVGLRNVSHWTFRLTWDAEGAAWREGMGLRIGLRLADGSSFWAATEASAAESGPAGRASAPGDWTLRPGQGGEPVVQTFALDPPGSRRPDRPGGRVVALLVAQRGVARTRIAEICLVRPLPVGAREGDRRILAGTVRDPAGQPVRREVRLTADDLERQTMSGEDGFYAFFDLPPRRRFELSAEAAIHWPRGRSVYTSSDYWDWDLIAGEPAGGGG